MTFEEFLKKKRIDLATMEKAEPGLSAEFRDHYELMGERSFDHTKKYWFNRLRHKYHLAPEVKTEKPHIANPLAEQTVTESLTDTVDVKTAPKPGFTPGFKAATLPNPIAEEDITSLPKDNSENTADNNVAAAPGEADETKPETKLGFTPKFRTTNPTKQAEPPEMAEPGKKAGEDPLDVNEETAPRPAYKPRFNMKNIPPGKG
jgi:hypothetical protein